MTIESGSLLKHIQGNRDHYHDLENLNFFIDKTIEFFNNRRICSLPLFIGDSTIYSTENFDGKVLVNIIEFKDWKRGFNKSNLIEQMEKMDLFFEKRGWAERKKGRISIDFLLGNELVLSLEEEQLLNKKLKYFYLGTIEKGIFEYKNLDFVNVAAFINFANEKNILSSDLIHYVERYLYNNIARAIAEVHSYKVLNLPLSKRNNTELIKITENYFKLFINSLEAVLLNLNERVQKNRENELSIENIMKIVKQSKIYDLDDIDKYNNLKSLISKHLRFIIDKTNSEFIESGDIILNLYKINVESDPGYEGRLENILEILRSEKW